MKFKKEKLSKRIAFRLSNPDHKALKEFCKENKTEFSYVLRELIRKLIVEK